MRASFLIGEVLTGLRRNVTMTLAMILTTAVSLAMLGGGLLAVQITKKTEDMFLGRLEIRLFLTPDISATDTDCTQDACKALLSDLKQHDGVVSVQFTNSADAKKEATEVTFKDQPEMVQMIQNTTLPASFRVKMSDPGRYPQIMKDYQTRPGVQSVHSDRDFVDRLVGLFDGLRNAAFGLAALQAVAALLLIANMVQIAAFTRREEVGIMRMVGASRWYTQLPFLLEAVIAALIGSALAVGSLFIARPLVINHALGAFTDSGVVPRLTDNDIALAAIYIIPVGIIFAAATAYGTLRYYVRN
ncbi:permease-like cell division protein FtsX [Nocardia terpenica]|uniref:Cell division protein FtsX n=1 Tax=Nocardia terpenica TaxID=455432 RepID=A0A164KV91_9NOCA|nr:permease-like cell division protein FtsX [Nocardia terpenica]ATL70063.1 ABC transporter permease [Nocardia terpenica]KZM71745.1 cell division protein FtsX [Nocardia terpenica]MBF6063398.1 ABC transporter permease [Nocardia terpenica]MBF6105954.1 ABC transporter permease [Nocardia terpenica]MBF6113461.1 ABC transporter permease [Nocardia terpenica]